MRYLKSYPIEMKRRPVTILAACLFLAPLRPVWGASPELTVKTPKSLSIQKLTGQPLEDTARWNDVVLTYPPQPISTRSPDFHLSFRDDVKGGDVVRHELWLNQGLTERKLNSAAGWVYVTPDERYVFSEPLFVYDVKKSCSYDLHKDLGLTFYTYPKAISPDGKRLLVQHTAYGMDPPADYNPDWFEITLP